MDEPDGFRAFVDTHSRRLLRSAWLLTGDWSSAEDLVQSALAAAWPRWASIATVDAARVRYVQRVMVTTYLRWSRRRWVGEIPARSVPDLPDQDQGRDAMDDAMVRQTLLVALERLSPRQRASIVLRYFADVPEAETARLMGCSVGSVKSHTSRALARLRGVPGLSELSSGGVG